MSERENFDWNDDTSFADLNDEQDVDQDALDFCDDSFDDMEDLPPIESLADDESLLNQTDDPLACQDEAAESPELEAAEAPEPKQDKRPAVKVPVHGLTTLFVFTVMVAGLGLGGALIHAFDVDPLTLWQPAGLMQFDRILDFGQNPLNLVYLVGMATLLLAALGGWALHRVLKLSAGRLQATEALLGKLSALRLEDEQPWLDPALKADTGLCSFASETLGSYRMLESRLKRYIGFEGEMRRLEKAVADDSREEIGGRYDHPAVGSLADNLVRYYDIKQQAMAEADEVRKKDRHEAESVVDVVQDARGWNRSTHDQLGIQGAALERLAGRVGDLSQGLADSARAQGEVSGQQDVVAQLQKGLSGLVQSQGGSVGQVSTELNDLVDQGSKLAFQVAMEVARLGTRGERLLPMTQTLEELTTSFRQVAAKLQDESGGSELGDNLAKLQSQLQWLHQSLNEGQNQDWQQLTSQAAEIGPAAGQVARNLEEIARGFNNQSDRLVKLGQSVADLASIEFDASEQAAGNPANPPEGSLKVTPNDPFGQNADSIHQPAEVDPFAGAEPVLGDTAVEGPDLTFESSVTPGIENTFTLDDNEVEQAPEPPLPTPNDVDLSPVEEPVASPLIPEDPAPLAAQDPAPLNEPMPEITLDEPESVVSEPEEKVYDLSEFGAQRLDEAPADGEDDEVVYDLTDLGAVNLND